MCRYHWPGNVRELENVILQVLSLCMSDVIGVEDLPTALQPLRPVPGPASASAAPDDLPLSFDAYEKLAIVRALRECEGNIGEAAKLLNVGKSTLYRKISNMNINFKDDGKL
jgi:transcriptional regulator of acetoin/glycerol metabolism